MSFVSKAKDKLRKEYDAYKYNKQLENNPDVVRAKLERARTEQRERVSMDRDKAELKEIQRSNSTVSRAIKETREYLGTVKQGKQKKLKGGNAQLGTGRNIIYDESPTKNSALSLAGNPQGSKSLILSNEKSTQRSAFGYSGGIMGQSDRPQQRKQKKSKQGKTIVIKL